jgi:periplasmic glucans biosynthesis protein
VRWFFQLTMAIRHPRASGICAKNSQKSSELIGKRREFLKLVLAGTLAATQRFDPAFAAMLGPATPFSPANLVDMAQAIAKTPYVAPKTVLPDPFANLTYEQYVAIRPIPGSEIWSGEKTGFAIEPLHRGFIYAARMDIYIVENGLAQKLIYDPSAFDTGSLQAPASRGDLGFSGFRILTIAEGQGPVETAIFQGASFFRSLARGQNFGVTARGLAIHTGDPQGEEFPQFRSVWIEKPAPASSALTIHALLDSASVTGALHFTLRPGEATIIDTELTIVARSDVDHIGIAAMTGTYLFGGLDHRKSDDIRPNVYEINGLQMLSGKGEWLWRPVANRETLQISAFADQNPRGFGLIQRDRSFEDFGDDDQHWELRPSLWIEPINDWGEGEGQLLEIPADSENNDNIIAYWRPKAALAAGASASFAYRQFWCWSPPARPPGAICILSRMGRIGKKRRFVVEFSDESFADPAKTAQITGNVVANPGQIVGYRTFVSRERKSLRFVFDLDPGSETSSELRVVLETAGKPVSETWLYRWTA